MMFIAVVYFAGPKTLWAQRVDESEVIASRALRWKWLASHWARSVHASLNVGRCGYAISKDGVIVEHVPPLVTDIRPPSISPIDADALARELIESEERVTMRVIGGLRRGRYTH